VSVVRVRAREALGGFEKSRPSPINHNLRRTNPLSLRFNASKVTLSGFAGGEYLPLPTSKGPAFPFLLTLDGYPTSPANFAQGQRLSPRMLEQSERKNIHPRSELVFPFLTNQTSKINQLIHLCHVSCDISPGQDSLLSPICLLYNLGGKSFDRIPLFTLGFLHGDSS
jgi:hypothetical protein